MLIRHRTTGLAATFSTLLLGLVPATAAQDHFTPIRWDDRGAPHVAAGTDEQVFFGQGYAVAVDRLAELHRVREATYGRLAKLTGNPTIVDPQEEGKSAFEQDKEVLTIGIRAAAVQRLATMDGATRQALEAYAAGVNFYLKELRRTYNGAGSLSLLLAEPIESEEQAIGTGQYPLWTPEDSIAAWIWWIYQFEQANVNYADELDCNAIPPDFLPVHPGLDVLEATDLDVTGGINDYWALFDTGHRTDCYEPLVPPAPLTPANSAGASAGGPEGSSTRRPGYRFSEVWALTGDQNANGDGAVVQVNPKTPMILPSMFHEVHLEQTDPVAGFDARGVQIVGVPGLFLGMTENVAWGVASLDADTDDLIQISTYEVPSEGTKFDWDNQALDITETKECIDDGTGTMVDHFVYTTPLGPVVDDLINPDLHGTDINYLLRSADIWHEEERQSIQSSIRMLKARNVASFRETTKFWTTPSVHCVVGDADGDVAYQSMVSLPTRGDDDPDAGARVVCGASGDADDWVRIVPFDYQPWTVKSTGYLSASNNRPAGCWYPIPMNLNNAKGPSTRTLRLWEILEGYEANYPSVTTAEDMARMSFDGVLTYARVVVQLGQVFQAVEATCPQYALSPAAKGLLNGQLANWDGEAKLTPGDACATGYLPLTKVSYRLTGAETLLEGFYGEGLSGYVHMVSDLISADLPVSFATCSDPITTELFGYVNRILTQAASKPCDPTEYDVDYTYFDFTKKIGGATPTLNGSKDVLDVPLLGQDKATLWAGRARAYAHTVDLSDPTQARGIRPLGNHEDPDHPVLGAYFGGDQNPVWLNGEPATGSTYLDDLDDMGLAGPGVIVKSVRAPYLDNASHFGVDYSGWDPQRALSIDLVDPAQDMSPGTTVQVRVSNLPRIEDFELSAFTLAYNVELRADTVKQWDESEFPVIHHVDKALTPVDAFLGSAADDIVLDYTIPMSAQHGDRIALQATLSLMAEPPYPANHPLKPDLKLSTMGLQLHVAVE